MEVVRLHLVVGFLFANRHRIKVTMKNIDRWAKYITCYGSESILIHTIPGTTNWIICQKIEKNKWAMVLGNPMGNVTYNLGLATDEEHLNLWEQILRQEIELKSQQIQRA